MFILRFTRMEHCKKLNIHKKYEEIFKSSRKKQIFQLFTVTLYLVRFFPLLTFKNSKMYSHCWLKKMRKYTYLNYASF